MKLTREALSQRKIWEDADFILPEFDIEKVTKETYENPTWIHMGAGNIFRAFPAMMQQTLLNKGLASTGIIVAEGYDYEIIEKVNKPHDNLTLLVTLKSNGSIEKKVVASIVESLTMDTENQNDFTRLKEIFRQKTLQMVSLTITEKGYSLVDGSGKYLAAVSEDFQKGPQSPISYIGKLAALCYERYTNGAYPVALVSMDNCSHNGTKLYEAVHAFAKIWSENGLVEKEFLTYIEDKNKVSFPWSMIDKITPRPDESVKKMLLESGFEDVDTIITTKNTYVAPFVNAEECEYLVIEDAFPNGHPPLEKAGVIFTEKEIVDKVEKMKVCTCLNPLHTALAIYGCLLSHTAIYKEMEDIQLKKLVEKIGYEEGLPVVVNPEIINPKSFIDEVLQIRVPNPFMPDTPQRIATDTSQKLSIRFGETIKEYQKRPNLDATDLVYIPLVLAGWCRYLMAIDDNGTPFELSSDPMLAEVTAHVEGIILGEEGTIGNKLMPLLSEEKIFGVDLYKVGLGEKVEAYFKELTAGTGAIRNTLIKYLG